MDTATLKIEGMHCGRCAETIKALIGTEPGVRGAAVSFKDGQARILYDPQTVGADRLIEVIERAGFRVLVCKA